MAKLFGIPFGLKQDEEETSNSDVPVTSMSMKMPDVDPLVKQSLLEKYGLGGNLSDVALKSAQDRANEKKSDLGWLQFAAGVGDAIAGRDPSNSAKVFQGIRDNIQDKEVGSLERQRKAKMEQAQLDGSLTKMQRESDLYDPNSQQSKSFRSIIESKFPDVAKAYGNNWGNVSAADKESIFEPLKLKEQIEARKDQARILAAGRADAASERNNAREQAARDKKEEKAKLSDAQLKDVQDFDDTINKAQSALAQLSDHSNWTGTIDGRVPDALVGSDQVAWRSAVGRMSDAYRKLITGAGASNQELARLEGRLPQPTDTFEDFKAKAKNLIQETQKAKQSHLKNLEYNGKNVTPFRDDPITTSSSSSGSFPRQVRKGNQVATVKNDKELKEAQDEGFQ